MLHTMFRKMKDVLPAKASFRLRTIKSDLVDPELRDLRRFAKALGGPALDAVDVGANSGIYSAALSGAFRRVIAIEPNPDCVAYIRDVLPENCTVVAAAVSDREGRTVLRVPVVDGASETTRATISADNAFTGLAVSDTREIDVEVLSIDGMARRGLIEPSRLALIKIDVEGHESAVLHGAATVLRTARPGLCIEMERRHGTQTGDALGLLQEIGYRAVRFDGSRYVLDDATAGQAAVGQTDDLVNLLLVAGERLERLLARP